MNFLYLDTETFSREDIGEAGTYRYAEHAEIMLLQWAVNDGPVHIWDHSYDEPFPDIRYMIERLSPVWVISNHVMFDRNVLRLGDRRVEIPIEQWWCTMVQAMQHGLPGGLDKLGEILGLPHDQRKQKRGKQLIQKFCKPAPRNHNADRYTRHTHPAEWQEFRGYGIQDVDTLREVHKRLPLWNWTDHDIERWHIDQRINDRGFNVDRELVAAGAKAATDEKVSLAKEFAELTGGLGPSQRQQVQRFLADQYGLHLGGTAKHIMEPIADDENQPHAVRRIASIMVAANKNSTAKYAAMHKALSTDGRFRGGLQFAGAARTRRWAGRVFQPHNLPARGLPKPEMIDAYIAALKAGCHRDMFDNLMLYGAAALRGVVLASPDKKLCVSDLSNIEGRLVAYLAGEEVKLRAFRDFDAGTGPDPYNVTVVSIIGGDPYDVEKAIRNVFGKVPDLALGFEGGVRGIDKFKKAYGVRRIDEYWPVMQRSMEPEVLDKAAENYRTWGHEKAAEIEMDADEWIACEAIKLTWRKRHPATKRLWYACKEAAAAAVMALPGTVYMAGEHLRFHCEIWNGTKWLLVRMPSGKYLTYFDPRVTEDGGISYVGLGSVEEGKPRAWMRLFLYGGKILENCIAEGTDVLTARGWVPIENVRDDDLVHDGVSFVDHGGKINSGVQSCVTVDGVHMTPDHEVLTDDGWQAASQNPRPYRPDLRDADGDHARHDGRPEKKMALPVRVRERLREDRHGREERGKARRHAELRVRVAATAKRGHAWARDVAAPGVRRVAVFARTVHEPAARCLAELRRSGYRRLSAMAGIVPEFLGGHGADVPARARTRSHRQQCELHTRQLPMDRPHRQREQPTQQPLHPDTVGRTDGGAGIAEEWHRRNDVAVQAGEQLAGKRTVQGAGVHQSVWDIRNAGPRQRFVVRGDSSPFIVHNCAQALAGDVLKEPMPTVEAFGYEIILSVHDELIAETADNGICGVDELSRIMARPPPWAPDLPLAADGFETYRYRKDD